jgi:DNA modification methylase
MNSRSAERIEALPIEQLIPYARNARTHSDAQVAQIAASIREFGFCNPVLIDGQGNIIAGHGRVLACRQLGLKTIPCVRLDHLTDTQRRAYTIADNKLALNADWDMELLALEFADLKALDFNIDLLGFDLSELATLDNEPVTEGDTEPQIDRAGELREQWGVEEGQCWAIGEHRLLCGDSTKAEDVARVMGGEKADAVLTDPPYGQNQAGVPNDDPKNHTRLMESIIQQLPITDGIVIAFQSPRTFHAWTDAARKTGFTFERMLWMYKAAQCTFPWRGWILKSESILVCSIGTPDWQEVHPFAHDCYYLSEVSGELDKNSGWHGSVKPMSVVSDLLSRISAPGSIIYEPFSGSGTTIIAAENLKRRCRAIEISPGYVAVALQRWADHTGQMPVLLP